MAEDQTLPGMPKRKLVKEVRKRLAGYGIRPDQRRLWLETWVWANQIAQSYAFTHWPIPSEIAAQYVFLLMQEMQAHRALKLPFRARMEQPPGLRERLQALSTSTPSPLILGLV